MAVKRPWQSVRPMSLFPAPAAGRYSTHKPAADPKVQERQDETVERLKLAVRLNELKGKK